MPTTTPTAIATVFEPPPPALFSVLGPVVATGWAVGAADETDDEELGLGSVATLFLVFPVSATHSKPPPPPVQC